MSDIDIENISIDNLPPELAKEILKQFPMVPEPERDYSKIIVIDHVPVIKPDEVEKKGKLTRILRRDIAKECGNLVDFLMPEFPDGTTCGHLYVEFETEEQVEKAFEVLNNKVFDKRHTFKVFHFSDFDRTRNIPEEYMEPKGLNYTDPDNLYSWLLNPDGCDQFVIRYDNETEVCWNGRSSNINPTTEVKKNSWTKKDYLFWSPLGTYLVLLSERSVQLYGGPNWLCLKEFPHQSVDRVSFSPDERYLITMSTSLADIDNEVDPQGIILWETVTQAKRRSFPVQYSVSKSGISSPVWPAFHWSNDSSYFSRLHNGYIMVYESSTMKLMQNKPIQLHSKCADHLWSPTDPILATYVPGDHNYPSRVTLFRFPNREVVSLRSYKNVTNVKFFWQKTGDFLAVKADRNPKNKKQASSTTFEFFRIRDREVPIETVTFEDSIRSFTWEPVGTKFAIVHAADKNDKPNVSIWSLEKELKKLVTIEKRAANHTSWSPNGRFLVLIGNKYGGELEFYDSVELDSLTIGLRHANFFDNDWDPTGRYFVSYVRKKDGVKTDNGYKLWTFFGVELREERKNSFFQFLWRPRPPSFLPKEKVEWLNQKENFKLFKDKYHKEDRDKREVEYRKRVEKREKIRKEYTNYMKRRIEENIDNGLEIDEYEDGLFYDKEEEIVEIIEVTEEIAL